MKTVFNRALSLVMCLILVCSTMSVTAFGANAQEDFSYKTYAQNATKENIHHLLDFLDDTLADLDINETIDLGVTSININLTSVDNVCDTIDRFRLVFTLAKGFLGDLKDLDLKVFDEGMSRAKSGDYKIFCEILELADANSDLIEKLISGTLDLGKIAENLGLDLTSINVSKMLREGIVDSLFWDAPNYDEILMRARNDFDAFVYTDLVGLVSAEGGILEGIEITEDTTVDHIITDAFNIIVNKYLIDLVKGQSFSFASLGEGYGTLDTVIQLDGDYSFDGIELTHDKSVLAQINGILGKVFAQIVPGFTEWETNGTESDYKNIGDNTRNLVKYIAEESKLGIDTNVSDEVLMLEILKIVFQAADTNGEKEIYELIKDTKTLTEMTNRILVHLSGKDYPADATYEHVFGDYLIEQLGGTIPLYDENGNAITVGSGKTVWEVVNSVLNFFLVDKNIEAYFGRDFNKSQSFFDKLDIMLSFTADNGKLEKFRSEAFIRGLFEDIFSMDLQGIIEATAVKALNFAGDVSVVEFLYNTVCNVVNNWAVSGGIEKQTSGHFEAAMKNEGLAKIVKAVINTLNSRVEGVACLVGVLYGAIDNMAEKAEEKDATCTQTGFKLTKTCLKCNKVYLKGATIAAKGHKYDSGKITKKPTCTAKGVKTFTCTVCGSTKTQDVAAAGHKASGYKTTVAATYKSKGVQINKCTVCSKELGRKEIKMLTLGKPSGLKASASSTTSIKFSWKKVANAESYNLLYRTGSGKWTTVKTTKTSVTVKKLKAGTTYKFKVVAVAGTNQSAASSEASATTKPATVTLKDLRSKKKKEVIAEWKKVSGATGYEVQYSTSKKFTKKATKTVKIKKNKTVKTYLKKLTSKKKYYVRVRAYKTVGKTIVYGAYSKTKSIKCK